MVSGAASAVASDRSVRVQPDRSTMTLRRVLAASKTSERATLKKSVTSRFHSHQFNVTGSVTALQIALVIVGLGSLALPRALGWLEFEHTEMTTANDVTDITTDRQPTTSDACVYSDWSAVCDCSDYLGNCGWTRNVTCFGDLSYVDINGTTRDNCLVQALWSAWGQWSACNDSCGTGWRRRTRFCDGSRAKPWQGVIPCNDSSADLDAAEQRCACPEWGEWSNYTSCAVSCGGGFRWRERSCGPLIVDGATCNGTGNETDICALDECSPTSDERAYGIYIGLTTTISIRRYMELRDLLRGSVIRAMNEYCSSATYYSVCCGVKAAWANNGTQTYVDDATLRLLGAFIDDHRGILYALVYSAPDIGTNRLCNGPSTAGRTPLVYHLPTAAMAAFASSDILATAVERVAAAAGIPVSLSAPLTVPAAALLKAALTHGGTQWSAWEAWTACNGTCGRGWRSRVRSCVAYSMQPWLCADVAGNGQNGSNVYNESQLCACAEWSAWGNFSACSVTCNGGAQTRMRDCRATGLTAAGSAPVCAGSAEETRVCSWDECPLSPDEETFGVYIGCITSMTVKDYIFIRRILQTAMVSAVNEYCSIVDNYPKCCDSKPLWSYSGVQDYVTTNTLLLLGAFRDEDTGTLYMLMYLQPDIDANELCNAPGAPGRRRKRSTYHLPSDAVASLTSSSVFTNAVVEASASAGFNATIALPLTAVAARLLKSASPILSSAAPSGVRTTIHLTGGAVTVTVEPTVQPIALIVGTTVGGGLGLIAIILLAVVIAMKKRSAKTGVMEITGDSSS